MATTLTYGFVKPQTGDKGSVFFPALEDNITQLNSHDHDGSDSAKLTAASSTAVTQSISSGSWAANGSGYRQTVTMPSGLTSNGGTFDDFVIEFRDSSTNERLYLDCTKVTDSTYYLYINDNTIDVTAVYA